MPAKKKKPIAPCKCKRPVKSGLQRYAAAGTCRHCGGAWGQTKATAKPRRIAKPENKPAAAMPDPQPDQRPALHERAVEMVVADGESWDRLKNPTPPPMDPDARPMWWAIADFLKTIRKTSRPAPIVTAELDAAYRQYFQTAAARPFNADHLAAARQVLVTAITDEARAVRWWALGRLKCGYRIEQTPPHHKPGPIGEVYRAFYAQLLGLDFKGGELNAFIRARADVMAMVEAEAAPLLPPLTGFDPDKAGGHPMGKNWWSHAVTPGVPDTWSPDLLRPYKEGGRAFVNVGDTTKPGNAVVLPRACWVGLDPARPGGDQTERAIVITGTDEELAAKSVSMDIHKKLVDLLAHPRLISFMFYPVVKIRPDDIAYSGRVVGNRSPALSGKWVEAVFEYTRPTINALIERAIAYLDAVADQSQRK